MRVMAIDPGSANVGVSIFDGQGLLFSTRVQPDPFEGTFTDKLNNLISKLYHQLLSLAHEYKITHICWEIYPPVKTMPNHRDMVVSFTALVKVIAFQLECQWQGIAANTVKKELTGNGHAKKIDIRTKIIELYPNIRKDFNLKLTDFDAYDSVAIGLICQEKAAWNTATTSTYTGKDW